jgi:transposase
MDTTNQEVPAQQVPAKRRRYADDFKQDAVLLIVAEGYSFRAAAQAVGVTDQTLRTWHAKLAPKPEPCWRRCHHRRSPGREQAAASRVEARRDGA